MILLALQGESNENIAEQVKLGRKSVGLWRRRWKESFDSLMSTECCESLAKLRRIIADVLSDAPHSNRRAGEVT